MLRGEKTGGRIKREWCENKGGGREEGRERCRNE